MDNVEFAHDPAEQVIVQPLLSFGLLSGLLPIAGRELEDPFARPPWEQGKHIFQVSLRLDALKAATGDEAWVEYTGDRRVTLYSDAARGFGFSGTGTFASGLAHVANIVSHERRHVEQVDLMASGTCGAFYTGPPFVELPADPALDMALSGWAFGQFYTPLTPASEFYNRFTDVDGDGLFSSGDVELDADADGMCDALDANMHVPNSDLEWDAWQAETYADPDLQESEWSSPGRQHHTVGDIFD